MKILFYFALTTVLSIGFTSVSMAGPGITDNCQDQVSELKDKIRDNKDDYTAESRRKAQRQLNAARTNRLDPVKCRGNVLEARKELQKGKIDKRKKD